MKLTKEYLIKLIKEEVARVEEEVSLTEIEEEKLDPDRPGMYADETEEEFKAAARRDAKEREARMKKRKERADIADAKRRAAQRAMRRR